MVETKIANLKTEIENYPAAIEKFQADNEKYEKTLIKLALDALTNKPKLIGSEHGSPIRVYTSYSGNVVAEFSNDALGFPKRPERPSAPNDKRSFGRSEYTTPLEMLEKTLKVLKMTTQEEVNASTYSSVMDLL
jgi:hypothetical protein